MATNGCCEDATSCNSDQNSDDIETGPFKATQLWYKIITYLKSHANLKRRRFMIRHYDNCFTGENAVNVVFHCLVEERKRSTLITNEIGRNNAVKVCQALMDNGVFESAGGYNKTRTSRFVTSRIFEDSPSKFYQFVSSTTKGREVYTTRDPETLHSTSIEEEELKNCGVVGEDEEKLNTETNYCDTTTVSKRSEPFVSSPLRWSICISPFRRFQLNGDTNSLPSLCGYSPIANDSENNPSSVPTRRKTRSVATRTKSTGGMFNAFASDVDDAARCELRETLESPRKNKNGKPNLLRFHKFMSSSSTSLLSDGGVSQTIDEDSVWKQVALSRLLTMIDLSFIDEILQSPKKSLLQRPKSTTCVISNHRLLAKLGPKTTGSNDNPWVRAAQEVTDSRCFLLDNPIHLSDVELKMQSFETVRRYYQNLPSPIVPPTMNKVFIAILALVKDGKFSVAIQALQLFVLLLPWQQKKELEQLLRFMQLATEDTSIRLKKQLTNRQYTLQQFTPVIVRYELLAQDQAAILVSFVLHNCELIFTIPDDVKREVEKFFLESRLTADPTPKTAIKYCRQIPVTSYDKDTKIASHKALKELLDSVMDSVYMSLRNKEKWLKRFRKCHPDLYEKWYKGEV